MKQREILGCEQLNTHQLTTSLFIQMIAQLDCSRSIKSYIKIKCSYVSV